MERMIGGEPLRRALEQRARRKGRVNWASIGEMFYMTAFASVVMVLIWLFLTGLS